MTCLLHTPGFPVLLKCCFLFLSAPFPLQPTTAPQLKSLSHTNETIPNFVPQGCAVTADANLAFKEALVPGKGPPNTHIVFPSHDSHLSGNISSGELPMNTVRGMISHSHSQLTDCHVLSCHVASKTNGAMTSMTPSCLKPPPTRCSWSLTLVSLNGPRVSTRLNVSHCVFSSLAAAVSPDQCLFKKCHILWIGANSTLP